MTFAPGAFTSDEAKAVGLGPEHAALYFAQATEFFAKNEFLPAHAAAVLAASCDNRNAKHWTLLGAVSAQLRMFGFARKMFDEAVARDPNEVAAYVGIGEILIVQQDFSAAQKALQKAVEADKLGQSPASQRARMLLVSRGQWKNGIPS